eukprot:scaffold199361_cov19-Tisochrysis_lutea.AAC.1
MTCYYNLIACAHITLMGCVHNKRLGGWERIAAICSCFEHPCSFGAGTDGRCALANAVFMASNTHRGAVQYRGRCMIRR